MNKQQIEQMAEALKWNASALSAALSHGKAIYPGQYILSESMGSKKVVEILDMADAALEAYQDAGKESEREAAEPKIFKCKCGYETSNSTAWCTHADSCNA